MEDGEIVDVLHVSFLEIRRDTILLPQEVERIQSFCLRFGDRRDILAARKGTEANKVAASVLQNNPVRGGRGPPLVEHERS